MFVYLLPMYKHPDKIQNVANSSPVKASYMYNLNGINVFVNIS
uniref:Uncharacterized protein n=1 Tax=Anguilla anguilla TaxID=7936 RepID=A0A0E9WJB4_ANGAN